MYIYFFSIMSDLSFQRGDDGDDVDVGLRFGAM
jgi:hypothetical protein